MPIDFSQARTPNFFEVYQQSFERGRALGRQRAVAAALEQYQRDPKGGLEGVQALDPALASRMGQDQAAANSRQVRDALTMQTLRAHGRAEHIEQAHYLTQVLQALRGATSDPAQRLAMAQHTARQHPEFGLSEADVAAADLSDQGIERQIAQLAPLAQMYRGLARGGPTTGPVSAAVPAQAVPDGFGAEARP